MIALTEQCLTTDPLRPVDWRWQLAGELATTRKRLTNGTCNELVLRAARFRRGQASGRRTVKDPTIEMAFELNKAPSSDQRLEIEARLLAGEELDSVARAVGQPFEVVDVYIRLFFDVRSRIDCTDYILCQVLTFDAKEATLNIRLRCFVHRMAYDGGPLVTQAVLDNLPAMREAVAGRYDFRSKPMGLEKRAGRAGGAQSRPR